MRHPDRHIFQFTPETLRDWCRTHDLPTFRADQILDWVYRKNVADPDKMKNLSPGDRELLAREVTFASGSMLEHQSATDGTQKLLIQWQDPRETNVMRSSLSLPQNEIATDSSRQTECVMIPAGSRRTACISSQVGCAVGCRFCASGVGGLDGNLSAGRIVEQVWQMNRLPAVERITNIVFMGMGEPLANFDPVLHAVRTLAAPWGMGVSARKITISTVGLPTAIEKLADQLELPVTLALSLHAPNDELRRELIPWAEYTSIKELLAACDKWFRKTGREITLEYILLGAVNDQPTHARQLVEIAKTLRANVNLIRYNEVSGLPFTRPKAGDVRTFQALLQEGGVNVHLRASRGRDIAAACGQLRHETQHA